MRSLLDSWSAQSFGAIPAVDIQGVEVTRGQESLLHSIDLSIRERDCFGIIGPESGGKSMLLRLILGLIPFKQGTVQLFGKPPTARFRRSLPVGYLPQFSQIPEDAPATVWDYVCMGVLGMNGLFRSIRKENSLYAENLLAAMHLEHALKMPVGRLSPGQQQRVRIARALVALPKLLVLDEPFQTLDPPGRDVVIRLLADLRRRIHTTMIIAVQDGKPLATFCNTVACLNHSLLWEAPCRSIQKEVWDDPCAIHPMLEEEDEDEEVEEVSSDGVEEEDDSSPPTRTAPRNKYTPNHPIQFWR